jgi:hypothetical protein
MKDGGRLEILVTLGYLWVTLGVNELVMKINCAGTRSGQ